MILYLLLAFFAGGLFGILGMAICKSGANEDKAKEIYYLRRLLQKILDLYNEDHNPWDNFHLPEQEIQEALKQ